MSYFRRIPGWLIIFAGWLIVFVIANTLAQSLPKEKLLLKMTLDDAETCTDEDYIISAAALNDLFGQEKPETVLLLDHTSIGFPPGMAAMTQFGGRAQTLLKDAPKEAKDDFDIRNKSRTKLDVDKIKAQFEISLLIDDEARKLVKGGWEAFHQKYRKTPGITLISRPGLNTDRNRALLYVGTSCGMVCGNGVFMLLGKDHSEWKVLNKVTIWIS